MKKKYFAFIFWAYILFLLYYSVSPTGSTSERFGVGEFKFRLDYWLHLGAYFGVAFLFIIWHINYLIISQLKTILLSFLLCVCFAYATEFVQIFVPGRTYNIKDFIANMIGISIAYSLFVVFKRPLRQSKLRFISV